MLRKPPCAEAHLSSPPGASPTSLLLGGGGREVPGAGSKSSRGLGLGVPGWVRGCFRTALGKAWGETGAPECLGRQDRVAGGGRR